MARAARTGQGVIVNDVQADPGFLPNKRLPDTRAEMAVPVMVGSKVLGVLDVQADSVDRFTDQDVQIQTTLAAQTAVALQNVRLFTQAEESAKELALINRIVTEVNTLGIQESLQFLAEELGDNFHIPSTAVGLIDASGTMLEIMAAYHPEGLSSPIGSLFPVASDPIMGQALQTRETVIIEDVANSALPKPVQEAILKTGTRSMYIVPMMVGRDLIGTVSMNFVESGSLLAPEQIKLAETIVNQTATAVQNRRLLTQSEESEEKFRSLFEQSGDAYLILEQNHFLECNQASIELLHASSMDEVLALHPSQISPEKQPDGRPSDAKADEMIQMALGKGESSF